MKSELYEQCKNCANFVQYYTLDGQYILTVREGHCRKTAKNSQPGCGMYEPNEKTTHDKVEKLSARLTALSDEISRIRQILELYSRED